eukprot:TRINITY_DN15757_c0_g1_i1.p1 TRINITY_DN15757_c0_g1~~TRINITY_DN15757_c0_g1_i1.p1  ORF type:complete len:522 (-),score=91.71 TRINITY_DN15757_c0_g1_i1:87-1556(-)
MASKKSELYDVIEEIPDDSVELLPKKSSASKSASTTSTSSPSRSNQTKIHEVKSVSELYQLNPVGESDTILSQIITLVAAPLCCLGYPGKIWNIPEGEIGLARYLGRAEIVPPGVTFEPSPFRRLEGTINLKSDVIVHGTITVVTINDGELGLAWDNGVARLLSVGRYYWNSPLCVFSEKKKLSERVVKLGPITIVTVIDGEVGISYDSGVLKILPAGRHILTSPLHVFKSMMSTRQEVHHLEANRLNTSDNVEITVKAEIFYRVMDAYKVVTHVNDIRMALDERAHVTLASIILSCPLSEIAPPPPILRGDDLENPYEKEHAKALGSEQFSRKIHDACMGDLAQYFADLGVQLIDVKLESIVINDTTLRRALGERAIITTNTATALKTAQGSAQVVKIQSESEARVILGKAKAEADSIMLMANARFRAASTLEDSLSQELALLDAMRMVVASTPTNFIIVPESSKDTANQVTTGLALAQYAFKQQPVA